MSTSAAAPSPPRLGLIETIQSLIVAFVMAMMFRGFVVEGFVIPTGSMAPTLLGKHLLAQSDQSGQQWPVGLDSRSASGINLDRIADASIGRQYPLSPRAQAKMVPRIGDRILIVKSLYPFFEPKRWDVVVFKNPAVPEGPASNYIKRLIGLPDETLWIVDGDIFVQAKGDDAFVIQTKPEHVQGAVWQLVYDADNIAANPLQLNGRYAGSPWRGKPTSSWGVDGRRDYATATAAPVTLIWDGTKMPLEDWTAYNALSPRPTWPVSDLRISAVVVPEQKGLEVAMVLGSRGHEFTFAVTESEASITVTRTGSAEQVNRVAMDIAALVPGSPTNLVMSLVDQQLSMSVGQHVIDLDLAWSPQERIRNTYGGGDGDTRSIETLLENRPQSPTLAWTFQGSPMTIHRLRLDRDLYYRPDRLSTASRRNEPVPGFEEDVEAGRWGFGTHPSHLAELGPNQFMMLGDNSAVSLDSRLWGAPAPLVATLIDPTPFVVDRRLLLGKAWLVYYPAPYPLKDGSSGLIPDFGSLRFIR